MTSLVDFPYGILSEILSLSRPYGYESLMLTCKAVYDAGKPLLEHHNRLRRQCRYLRIMDVYHRSGPGSDWNFNDLELEQAFLRFVKTALADPMTLEYVRTLSVVRSEEGRHRQVIPDFASDEEIVRLMSGSHVASVFQLHADYWLARVREDGQCCLLLLLALFPNLEELVLPRSWAYPFGGGDEDYLGSDDARTILMKQLISDANRASSSCEDRPLSKLMRYSSMIDEHSESWLGEQLALPAREILPFMALDSLLEFEADHFWFDRPMYEDGPGLGINRNSLLGTNLRSLKLEHAIMDGSTAHDFFRNTCHLENLRFSYRMHDEAGGEWDADAFMCALQSTLSTTLRKLSLGITCHPYDMEPLRSETNGFDVLEHLELDIALFDHVHGWDRMHSSSHEFCEIPIEDSDEEDFESEASKSEDSRQKELCYAVPLHRFVPRSLKNFRLLYDDGAYSREHLESLLQVSVQHNSLMPTNLQIAVLTPGFRIPFAEPHSAIPSLNKLEREGILHYESVPSISREWP